MLHSAILQHRYITVAGWHGVHLRPLHSLLYRFEKNLDICKIGGIIEDVNGSFVATPTIATK